jgi:hypothetical protein
MVLTICSDLMMAQLWFFRLILLGAFCPCFGFNQKLARKTKSWLLLGQTDETHPANLKGLSLSTEGTSITDGPEGMKAWEFHGHANSYVKITSNGELDFGESSWSLGYFFYQEVLRPGPLLYWRGNNLTKINNMRIFHWPESKPLPYLTFFFLPDNTKYKDVRFPGLRFGYLGAKSWNFLGLSYNAATGLILMWVNGIPYHDNIGIRKLAMIGDVFIGVDGGSRNWFPMKAKLAGLTLLNDAITSKQIPEFRRQIIASAATGRYIVTPVNRLSTYLVFTPNVTYLVARSSHGSARNIYVGFADVWRAHPS